MREKLEKLLSVHIENWSLNSIESRLTQQVYTLPFNQLHKYSEFLDQLEKQDLKLSLEMASLEEAFINFHNKEMKEEMDTFEEDD